MWIVRLALRRPLSVAVMALLIMILGAVSFVRMNIDIFPTIDLPVAILVWSYPGLPAEDMERRVVLISERASSTNVNDIEHIESESLNGVGLVKVYFHPGVTTATAIAQLSAVSETVLRIFPPGMTAPQIIDYNAANVPIAQLNVFSDTLSEQKLFDYGLNFIRLRLFTIEGASSPAPFGGMTRQVMVNIHPDELYSRGLSPQDVISTLQSSNVILPAGTAKIGNLEYNVVLNGSPLTIPEFNRLPVKVVGRTPVFLGDVASVSDSHAVQTNIARVNGRRATYLLILKHASASTLAIINQVKEIIPLIQQTAPKGLKMALTFDQSIFVRNSLKGVAREAGLAALLVALMVLLFLGSWRSTLVVIISIPLCIFAGIIGLKLSGQTINIMSLGGLALAVGMLVDDATVEVENIHRNHAMGKPLLVAILDAAHQIAMPAFVGTLAICIVFFPVALLYGVAKYLFTPLALSVVYSMLTSYLLSRTLVPTMSRYLLPAVHDSGHGSGIWGRFNRIRDERFDGLRERYRRALGKIVSSRGLVLTCVTLIVVASGFLLLIVGEDFFPTVDAGLMQLHVRVPPGTRIEETERIVDRIEDTIRRVIPADELDMISDNIGLPVYYNLSFYRTDSIGSQDADLQIALKPSHRPTAEYIRRIREVLHQEFPAVHIYFQAADIVSQVLNFGLSAPIDVQIEGNDLSASYDVAERLKRDIESIPGATDVRIAQVLDYPTLRVRVDRAKALELGITQNDVASSLLTSLSSSSLGFPNYWLNPNNNVNYTVAAQTPQHMIDSIQALGATPLSPSRRDGTAQSPQFLSNLATVSHEVQPWVINHYTVQRVIDINCNVEGRDLGAVSTEVKRRVDALGHLPPGMRINVRGQSAAMRESFSGLSTGLILAVVLVYLLMVTSFQSWLEPFVIIMAVPGALAGVLWMLVLTGTTLNVESLMGTVMAVGVGVANGNLVITFANDLREQGYDTISAAIGGGVERLRPVLMTALAMILGMLPMALALGEGGEQNAPLGRALIGGLLGATAMTLFVVPAVYSIFGAERIGKHQRDAEIAAGATQTEND